MKYLQFACIPLLFVSCGGGGDEAASTAPPGTAITFSNEDLVAGGQSAQWFFELVEDSALSIGNSGPLTEVGAIVFDVWQSQNPTIGAGPGYSDGDIYVSYLEIGGVVLVGSDLPRDDSYTEFELQSDGTFTAEFRTTVSVGQLPDMVIVRALNGEMNDDKLSLAGNGRIDFLELWTGAPYPNTNPIVGTFSMDLNELR